MKDKNVAALLALFFGAMGVHRFYLGQVGLGILYVMFFFISWMFGLIDAVAFLLMDDEEFDRRYNRKRRWENRRSGRDQRYQDWRDRQDARRKDWQNRSQTAPGRPASKATPFKQSGIRKFKEYDYKGAIEDFEKALEQDEKDIAIHFNLACAYSLEENLEKSLFHLDRAVAYGFKDFDRIRTHDAFAFVRIQKAFADFEDNKFRIPKEAKISAPPIQAKETVQEEADLLSTQPDLLDQIKKLGDLREKGLLTEEEFAEQKRKLMG